MSILFPLLFACTGDAPTAAVEGELVFVRGGVITPEAVDGGQPLAGGGRLVARDWSPGDQVSVGALSGVGPAQAECAPLFQVDLGDVARLIAMGGPAPNTAVAWSPDGSRLAIGSHRGEVVVVDGWSGAEIARKRLAETMVKGVAWSPDGATLYAAEQSPDAAVYAFDPASLESRWTLRLADLVETSAPPPAEDLYGIYSLPAAFGLGVLPDGDLVLAAAHGWTDDDGEKRNLAQLLRVAPDGAIAARWPAEPADAILKNPRVDAEGGLVAVAVTRSASGEDPTDLPIGGVQVVSLPDLEPVASVEHQPLAPWFTEAYVWEGLDVSRSLGAFFLGYGDGRAQVLDLDGAPRLELTTGTPVMAGDVPIHASVGWGFFQGGGLIYSTSNTYIPWGAASPELRPPSAHPNANTVWSVGLDGAARWSWTGPWKIEGLSLSPGGDLLAVGAGPRSSDDRRDLYGALLLALGGPERSGDDRVEAVCATEGPVFFRHALSHDGRLAVAEQPYADGEGGIVGGYRVVVFR